MTWSLALANVAACFIEGGLGFGGSLTFLALTVPFLGWSESLLTDCIFASANLAFVAFLDRNHLKLSRVLKAWSVAVVPLALGALAFSYLPAGLRSLPVILMGVLILWRVLPIPRSLLAPFAGLGVGLGNTEEPFGFLLFQRDENASIANTAAFAGGLLAIKATLLWLYWPRPDLPSPLTFGVGFLTGAIAAVLGRNLLGRLDLRQRHQLVRILVPTAAAGLALGAALGRS